MTEVIFAHGKGIQVATIMTEVLSQAQNDLHQLLSSAVAPGSGFRV